VVGNQLFNCRGFHPAGDKDRIFATARKFKYPPNFLVPTLRAQRSFTIGVIVPEVSDGYSASVMSGIEDRIDDSAPTTARNGKDCRRNCVATHQPAGIWSVRQEDNR